jgi:hypothetical protein
LWQVDGGAVSVHRAAIELFSCLGPRAAKKSVLDWLAAGAFEVTGAMGERWLKERAYAALLELVTHYPS